MRIESLDLSKVLDQITEYCDTELGQQVVLDAIFFTNKLGLMRELARQQTALQAVHQQGAPSFVGLLDLTHQLQLISKQGILDAVELSQVANVCKVFLGLKRYYQKRMFDFEQLADLFESLSDFSALVQKIDQCITYDGYVLDQASPTLAKIRKAISQMDTKIQMAVNHFIDKNKALLSAHHTTIKNNRIVLPVLTSYKNQIKGLIHDQSGSGQTTFLEPQFLIELNNEKQNLFYAEHEEIVKICQTLSNFTFNYVTQIENALESAVVLDAYFGKAKWAKTFNGCVATLTKEALALIQARHPLIDPNKVVANTYRIESGKRIILITGPNTGGKTVGLKTIGLAVYLTHCGFPVLCQEAWVPFVDQVFVDIGDHQSVVSSLSTFSGHLMNLKAILQQATPYSFVLLDELGSGTDPMEGESLAVAILEHLNELGCFGVITTHFNRLKMFAAQHESFLSSSVQFDLENLAPTYRYQEGLAGQSYALDIAGKLEIDPKLIQRAKQIRQQSVSEQEQLMEQLQQQLELQSLLNDQLKSERQQVEHLKTQLQLQNEQFEREKESMKKAFELKQAQKMQKTLRQASSILAELRETVKLHEAIEKVTELNQLTQTREQTELPIDVSEIQVGDHVYLPASKQTGIVDHIKKNQAQINVNGLRVLVSLNQLQKLKAPVQLHEKKKRVKKTTSGSVSMNIVSDFKRELNIIGMRYEQAMQEVDQYLDQCLLYHLKSARIVHGFGTGALRNGVADRLKKHKSVKSFRLGGEGEGGQGVTIVEFK